MKAPCCLVSLTRPYISRVILTPMATPAASSEVRQDLPNIDAAKAHELLGSGHSYIDVRMPEDFEKAHAPGARNVPFYTQGKDKNPRFVVEVAALCSKDDTFIVACNTGNRSRFATADLLDAGFKNVKNLGGGFRSFLQYENEQPAQQQE